MRRLSLLLIAGACAFLALGLPRVATGATYTTSCPVADDSCAALVERLEALVAVQESSNAMLNDFWAGNAAMPVDLQGVHLPDPANGPDGYNPQQTIPTTVAGILIPPGAFEPRVSNELPVSDARQRALLDDGEGITPTTTAVRLGTADRERLDLSWWGAWAIVGLMLVQLIAPYWARAWRFWRD
jgi:hypothetical protein